MHFERERDRGTEQKTREDARARIERERKKSARYAANTIIKNAFRCVFSKERICVQKNAPRDDMFYIIACTHKEWKSHLIAL